MASPMQQQEAYIQCVYNKNHSVKKGVGTKGTQTMMRALLVGARWSLLSGVLSYVKAKLGDLCWIFISDS
jgi:hypothetical protein